MTVKNKEPSRLAQAIHATAKDMRQVGVLDDAAYDKITLRHPGPEEKGKPQTLTGRDIRLFRKRAHMRQAVFAHHINAEKTAPGKPDVERRIKRKERIK